MSAEPAFNADEFYPRTPEVEIKFYDFDGVTPPPRPWAFGDILMLRTVTAVASPPGTGKTTWGMQVAIAFGLHRNFGPWEPQETGRVLILNAEEDADELKRRLLATCYEVGIAPGDTVGRVYFHSTLDHGALKLVRYDAREGAYVRDAPAIETLKAEILAVEAKLFVLDPLIEFHECPETNEGFSAVGGVLREIAVACGCAILAFHHTPKSADSDTAAGNLNALRGGGSLAGIARFVLTIFGMSDANAKDYGVSKREARHFARVDSAKANMTLTDGRAHWFRKVGVSLNNKTETRPADQVGVFRYTPLALQERGEKVEREDAVPKLAADIVRFCVAKGHTSQESTVPLDTLAGALDFKTIGLKKTAIKGRIVGDLAPMFEIDGKRIVVITEKAGKMDRRRIFVEDMDGAN